jgi:hypothetical protein
MGPKSVTLDCRHPAQVEADPSAGQGSAVWLEAQAPVGWCFPVFWHLRQEQDSSICFFSLPNIRQIERNRIKLPGSTDSAQIVADASNINHRLQNISPPRLLPSGAVLNKDRALELNNPYISQHTIPQQEWRPQPRDQRVKYCRPRAAWPKHTPLPLQKSSRTRPKRTLQQSSGCAAPTRRQIAP